ncbi:MAG: hypothetical protein A3B82_00890 [Methylophilales bacterium RIFCSPHIGHO2_02_FULL_57_10]|nr:MAG: hypothetical protein A3B82_00890 [Methylophilales bacterium RIFCSPHIGHO2_02_FULL_57_10]
MRSMIIFVGLLVLLSGCASSPSTPDARPKIDRITPEEMESLLPRPAPNLSQDELVRLSKAGETPDAIIAKIRDSHSSYTLTPAQMIDLYRQGVDTKVLDYIQSSWEQAVREGLADEFNQRERKHQKKIEALQRKLLQRPYFCDPYWSYPYWPYHYPPGWWYR